MVLTSARLTSNAAAVGVKILMNEEVLILPIDDVPLQQTLGTRSIGNIKPQWLNDALDPQTSVPSTTYAAGVTTLVMADSTPLRVGDVIRRRGGTVLMKVLTNVYGTNTITVTRPFAGSTDESVGAADFLDIVGQDTTEGQDPPDPRDNDFTGDFNFTQIYQEAVQASRTAKKNDQYYVDDPYAQAVMKKFRELNIRRERTMVYGRRNQSGATRQQGGLQYFLATSVPNKSGVKANLETLLGDMLEAAYGVGASPTLLHVSPAIKRIFSGLGGTLVTEMMDETKVGRVKTVYHSDFGDVELVKNRHIDRTKGFLLTPELVTNLAFEPWFQEMLAKTGDTDKGEIVGEYSMEVRHAANAHGILTVTDA